MQGVAYDSVMGNLYYTLDNGTVLMVSQYMDEVSRQIKHILTLNKPKDIQIDSMARYVSLEEGVAKINQRFLLENVMKLTFTFFYHRSFMFILDEWTGQIFRYRLEDRSIIIVVPYTTHQSFHDISEAMTLDRVAEKLFWISSNSISNR